MKLAIDDNAKAVQALRPVSTEALAISGTAASGAALTTTAKVLRMVANTACFYRLDGTATTSSAYLPADVVEYIRVDSTDTLSVITSGASGVLYISECV